MASKALEAQGLEHVPHPATVYNWTRDGKGANPDIIAVSSALKADLARRWGDLAAGIMDEVQGRDLGEVSTPQLVTMAAIATDKLKVLASDDLARRGVTALEDLSRRLSAGAGGSAHPVEALGVGGATKGRGAISSGMDTPMESIPAKKEFIDSPVVDVEFEEVTGGGVSDRDLRGLLKRAVDGGG